MRRLLVILSAVAMTAGLGAVVLAEHNEIKTGEKLFKEHCAVCHPDGGNIINPSKTLRKADLEAHQIVTKEDIVEQMRHPGKGMTSWSAATLPDDIAGEIADYILKTFR